MPRKKPIIIAILDGFGFNKNKKGNAIALAKTPHIDDWKSSYPTALLNASGEAVGLPKGFIGNSEVGHLTIGAGRIIPQSLWVMQQAVKSKQLAKDPKLIANLKKLAKNNGSLHIMGLLSDAGVHSHQDYLYALIKIAHDMHIPHIYIHPFLDGRDVKPNSAHLYLEKLERTIKKYPNVSIGSLHGRLYAMDRNQNLDRTQKSFVTLTKKTSSATQHWQNVLSDWYKTGSSEEFLPPEALDPNSYIKPKDGIIFFNFRPDRARQLTRMLLQWHNAPLLSFFITPYAYDPKLKTTVLYKQKVIKNTLTDVLRAHHVSVYAIAETEKYAHITYFFNAGREKPYKNETWTFIPSLKPQSFALHPAMSAAKITTAVLKSLRSNPQDIYLINYANADMVGHSGNLNATIQAIECLDTQLKHLYNVGVKQMDGTLIITADHGNAEKKVDLKTGQPLTAHTTNRVPFLLIRKDLLGKKIKLPLKELADIAPFLLNFMGLSIPVEMKINKKIPKLPHKMNLLGFFNKSATQIK
jgi:2,3-bisphosphoglycerate-independent phosphoglycerate mutase